MPRPATLTNLWVRKTRAGSKMFFNAKIAELESPEQAFSAFFMQILIKWAYCDYFTLLQAMLFVSRSLMQSTHGCLCSIFHVLGPILIIISEKLYFSKNWSFINFLMIINSICLNSSHYSVSHATKSAGINAVFGCSWALLGSRGAKMLGSQFLEMDETKFWEEADLDTHWSQRKMV